MLGHVAQAGEMHARMLLDISDSVATLESGESAEVSKVMLASVAAGASGAALVGVEDAANILTATTVEGALAEVKSSTNTVEGALAEVQSSTNTLTANIIRAAFSLPVCTSTKASKAATSSFRMVLEAAAGGIEGNDLQVALTSAGALGVTLVGDLLTIEYLADNTTLGAVRDAVNALAGAVVVQADSLDAADEAATLIAGDAFVATNLTGGTVVATFTGMMVDGQNQPETAACLVGIKAFAAATKSVTLAAVAPGVAQLNNGTTGPLFLATGADGSYGFTVTSSDTETAILELTTYSGVSALVSVSLV